MPVGSNPACPKGSNSRAFSSYIEQISFCYFHEIYGNLHPVDIFLPTDMTLDITPISDIEFEFLFRILRFDDQLIAVSLPTVSRQYLHCFLWKLSDIHSGSISYFTGTLFSRLSSHSENSFSCCPCVFIAYRVDQ